MNFQEIQKISEVLKILDDFDNNLLSHLKKEEIKPIVKTCRKTLENLNESRVSDCYGNIYPCVVNYFKFFNDDDGYRIGEGVVLSQFGLFVCKYREGGIWYFDGKLF